MENELSSRRGEIKVRKNEMKLRKNEIISPKNFSFPRWRISVCYRGVFDFLGGVGSRESKSVGVPRRSERLEVRD